MTTKIGWDWPALGVATTPPKGKWRAATTSASAKVQTAGAEHWVPSGPHLGLSLDCGLTGLNICCWCAQRRFASREPLSLARLRVVQIRMPVNYVHFLPAGRFTWETKWQSESITRSMGPQQGKARGQPVRSPPPRTTKGLGMYCRERPSSTLYHVLLLSSAQVSPPPGSSLNFLYGFPSPTYRFSLHPAFSFKLLQQFYLKDFICSLVYYHSVPWEQEPQVHSGICGWKERWEG